MITILVVDDSSTDRAIISSMLSDYNVLTATNGREALELLEQNPGIDVMVLDLYMPVMDGFEVLEALRGSEKHKHVRTIILTNYDEIDKEIEGLKLGAVDYIRKPIQMESLRARIQVHETLISTRQIMEQKLHEQAHTFEMIANQVPVGIMISFSPEGVDADLDDYVAGNQSFYINPAFERITGRTKEELLKVGWAAITHPDDLERDGAFYKQLVTGQIDSYEMEKRYIRPDGGVVWVFLSITKLFLSQSRPLNHIALIRDITQSKLITEELIESERSKAVLLSNLQGMAYRCRYDRDWTMLFVSSGCQELTGYGPEDLVNSRRIAFNDLISPEYRDILWKRWEQALAKKQPFRYEYELITAQGARKWVLETGQGVYNDRGEVEALEGIIIDISDRKELEDHLIYVNEHDKLTGLHNREYLEALLESEARKGDARKRALVSVNLSMVQVLTANYGFHYTQSLIGEVAKALDAHCTQNRMLFQTHENRFVFYLQDYKDKSELIALGEAIAETLENLFVTDRISGGIGILEIGQDETEIDANAILRRLLIASERSVAVSHKDFGITLYNDALENIVNREGEIRHALSAVVAGEPGHELIVQYQPILDVKTGAVVRFEALARLRTEALGLLSPLEFIPIAEKTKLILPLGESVFIRAFAFLKTLSDKGHQAVRVSVNVSIIQLLYPDFADWLTQLMNTMGVDPGSVGIEITESIFTSDYAAANRSVVKLQAAGMHVSIDDFGIAYSSLARLKRLHIDCLKIDKYFIDRLLDTDPGKLITGDIISMAHRLGYTVVAEGVEQESQLRYLEDHGCDSWQGFLVARPMDAGDALLFLEARKERGQDAGSSRHGR